MRGRRFLITILALGVVVAAGLVAYRLEALRGPAICQVCGRYISKQTAYRLDTTDGTINACCPACALHYMLHRPDAVLKGWATDFASGRLIPASSAYFDEGGDMQYCTAHIPASARGPEGVSARVYDRCLPSLVAFASRSEADTYQQKHGGRILTYDQTLASLQNR